MAVEVLGRFPTEPNKPLPPERERWYTALVRIVNTLLTGAVDLAALIAANTASIVINTAAIALLQPTYGTWTPVDGSGAALAFTFPAASTWAKLGRLVVFNGSAQYPATGNGAGAMINGLPFASASTGFWGAAVTFTTSPANQVYIAASSSGYVLNAGGAQLLNSQMSTFRIEVAGLYLAAS